ncbi:MAG TPA: universal stress protein [Jatrophihabitantaceae bacterium]|jgi:nucleotide-binding universal stress UspA family protein
MISNSIIVGVDGSSGARSALRFAVDECRLRRRTLIVAHTPDLDDLMPASGEHFERAALAELGERLLRDHAASASARQPGVVVTTRLLAMPAAEALIEMSEHADLIVAGRRTRGDIAASILGSVSHRVAAHAQCPVVVIPERRTPGTQTLENLGAVEVGRGITAAVYVDGLVQTDSIDVLLGAVVEQHVPRLRAHVGQACSRPVDAEDSQDRTRSHESIFSTPAPRE